MASGIDPAPSKTPGAPLEGVLGLISAAYDESEGEESGETMPEIAAENADHVSPSTAPPEQPIATERIELQTRTATGSRRTTAVEQPKKPKLLAREFLRLNAMDSSLSLKSFAEQHGLHHSTLQYHCKQLTEEERLTLQKIGQIEAEEKAKAARAAELKQRKEETMAARRRVGAHKHYLRSGLTDAQYQTAHQWGVQQIIAGKLTLMEAERAIFDKFGGIIRSDTMRMAAKKYAKPEGVPKPKKKGPGTLLPPEVEEGLVEVVEFLRTCSPPFPVFKQYIVERAQFLVKSQPEFEHFWAARDNRPTNAWYYCWKARWAHRLGSATQSIIELDREKWATSENIAKHYDVVHERLMEIGFLERNPDFDPAVEWSEARESSGDKRILRAFWTEQGKERTISMDESELTNNQAGSRSGRKAKGEETLVAKQYEQSKKGVSGGNKTANKASGVGGSRVRGEALPGFSIHTVEPDPRWFKHPKFRLPATTWKHPVSGKEFVWKCNHNECGGMNNDMALKWLEDTILRRFDNDGSELYERGGVFQDCSPENPVVLICDASGHCSHMSLPFLRRCKEAGVILIWRLPHTSHVIQGEDLINFALLKHLISVQTSHAARQKYFLQPPFNDILAWGGGQISECEPSLGAHDLMYCVSEPWKIAFSEAKNREAWARIGIFPFTQRVYWELKAKEEGRDATRQSIKEGITKLDWAEICGVKRGADLDVQALNETVQANGRRRRKRLTNADYFDRSHGFEEMLADQEERERAREDNQVEQEKQDRHEERDDTATQKRRDAKQLVEELKTLVMGDGGQWNLRKSGQAGGKITRAHLDAVILAMGKPRNSAKMEELVAQVQELLRWDAAAKVFSGVMGWDEAKKCWAILSV